MTPILVRFTHIVIPLQDCAIRPGIALLSVNKHIGQASCLHPMPSQLLELLPPQLTAGTWFHTA